MAPGVVLQQTYKEERSRGKAGVTAWKFSRGP